MKKSNWKAENNHHYQSAEYRRNRKKVMERDLGMCVRCWTLYEVIVTENIQCDHYIGIKGNEADHSMSNLWLLCAKCHSIKTAQEAHHKFNPSKPFGDYDTYPGGWPANINWRTIIAMRNNGLYE